MLIETKNFLNKVNKMGFFHILFGTTAIRVISFISALFLPRFLDKYDYGILIYVDNLRTYLLLINGLGLTNSILKYVPQSHENMRKSVFDACMRVSVLFDIVMVVLVNILVSFIQFEQDEVKVYFIAMSLLPLFTLVYENIQMYFRSTFKNKEYSRLAILYSLFTVAFQIIGALCLNIVGVIIARYIAVFLVLLFSIAVLKINQQTSQDKSKISFKMMKKMIIYGISLQISGGLISIVGSNESIIISNHLNDIMILADYKVANYFLIGMSFVVQSIVVFIIPYFAKNIRNQQWIRDKYKKILIFNTIAMLCLHLLLLMLIKPLIFIVFGEKYMNIEGLAAFVLVVSFFQTTFRTIPANILPILDGEKETLLCNTLIVIIHYFMANFLIRNMGIYGAPFSLIFVYCISGTIMHFFVMKKISFLQ